MPKRKNKNNVCEIFIVRSPSRIEVQFATNFNYD